MAFFGRKTIGNIGNILLDVVVVFDRIIFFFYKPHYIVLTSDLHWTEVMVDSMVLGMEDIDPKPLLVHHVYIFIFIELELVNTFNVSQCGAIICHMRILVDASYPYFV